MSNWSVIQRRYEWMSRATSAILVTAGFTVTAATAAAGCGGNNNPCRAAPAMARPAAPPAMFHMQTPPPAVARPSITPTAYPTAPRTFATQVAPNPHPLVQRAAMLPMAPQSGFQRPMPHFAGPGVPGQPPAPVVFEFYRPAAPFTRGVSFGPMPSGGGSRVFFGIPVAAPVNADPMALVQYNTVVVASGNDVRQAYVADVGSPPNAVQVVGFNVGASRPVIDRSSNDFMMIKGTGAVVVPDGSQAVANAHLLLYPPGADRPREGSKALALAPDGGQFENQFSIPLSSDSPQGEYKYTVQVVVNQQVMGEQNGTFQAL